jgi:hypothetical protein
MNRLFFWEKFNELNYLLEITIIKTKVNAKHSPDTTLFFTFLLSARPGSSSYQAHRNFVWPVPAHIPDAAAVPPLGD